MFDHAGAAMSPTHTRRKGRLYRYYISQRVIKGTPAGDAMRVPAGEIEAIAIEQIRRLIVSPEIVVATWKQLHRTSPAWTETEVQTALQKFDDVWDELFPAEQSRIATLVIDKVVVCPTKVDVHLLIDGFASLAAEIAPGMADAT
jgi:hypothetical protein